MLRASRMQHDHATWRHLRSGLLLLVVLAPVLVGGAHVEVNVALAAAAVALLLVLTFTMGPERRLPFNLPVVGLVLALGLTLLQLVPLPLGVVGALSPKAHDVLSLALPAGAWAPLSLDPPATAHEATKLVLYLAASLLALRLLSGAERERQLLAWVVLAGAVVASIGLLHELSGLDRTYGVFGPRQPGMASSFVNPNHLGGFLGVTGLVALGLFGAFRGGKRVLLVLAALLCAVGLFATLSRGAVLGFGLGLLCYGLLAWRARGLGVRELLVTGALGLALLVAVSLAGFSELARELWSLSGDPGLTKAAIWEPVPRLLSDFVLLGVGRGAWAAIYPHYLERGVEVTFTHAENEVLQLLVDWGPLGGGLLLAVAAASLVLAAWRRRVEPSFSGVLAALLFIGTHNLVDFSLELTGVALPVVLLVVVAVGRQERRSRAQDRQGQGAQRRFSWHLGRAPALGVALGLVAVSAGVGFWAAAYELERDTARLELVASQDGASDAEAAAICARHPADHLLPLLFAERQLPRRADARALMPWINRGLYLAPQAPSGHVLAGRALLRLGARQQAVLEYGLAVRAAPHAFDTVAGELMSQGKRPAEVARLAGDDPLLKQRAARFLLAHGAPQTALELVPEGGSPESAALRTRALLSTRELDRALVAARALEAAAPSDPRGYLLQAEAHGQLGQKQEARAALERGTHRAMEPLKIMQELGYVLIDLGALDEAEQVAQSLLQRSAAGPPLARAYALLGLVEQRRGHRAAALRQFQRARDAYPPTHEFRLNVARVLHEMGDDAAARAELDRAEREVGASPLLERERGLLSQ